MRRPRLAPIVVIACLIGAIASAAAAAGGPSPGVMTGSPGIAVAGGAHVIATAQASSTVVSLVRDRDAKVLRSRVLAGKLGIPLVTFGGDVEGTWSHGQRLVLSTSIYDSQARTRFVTLDTRTLAPIRTIALSGAFAYDALSPDGRRLYVLHFPSGLDGGIRYVVRSLNLLTGRLDRGTIVDKREPDEQMNGLPLARTSIPGRGWVFTLYRSGTSQAFVHALDTKNRLARCLDLPWKGAAQDGLETVRLAIDKAGMLTLRQPSGGLLARIDTRTFVVDVLRKPVAPSR